MLDDVPSAVAIADRAHQRLAARAEAFDHLPRHARIRIGVFSE
jgi:hypothetical protein